MREAQRTIATHESLAVPDECPLDMIIRPQKNSVLSLSETIPPSLKKYIIPGAHPFAISGSFGEFIFQEFKIGDSGPCIRYNHYFLAEEELFTFISQQAHLQLQFSLSNNFYTDPEGLGKWKIGEGSYNLFFVPSLNTQVRFRPGRAYTELTVSFQPGHLVHLAPCNAHLDAFLQKVALEQACLLHPVNQPLTELMERIIRDILISHLKGPMQFVYLENKVSELLLTCLDPQSQESPRMYFASKENEIEKIYEAKKLWLANIQEPLSLCSLSKKTGLNIKKLKAGFKEIFGHSPYELILQARMELAENLLTETHLPVSEIADRIGYWSSQSFAKAFKLWFRVQPLQYRNKIRAGNSCPVWDTK